MMERWAPALFRAERIPIVLGAGTHQQVRLAPVKSPMPAIGPDRKPWPTAVWRGSGFAVIASLDATPHGQLLHVSISHKRRHPAWEEIKHIRSLFFPDTIDVMMMLPQAADYINAHEHCFHLWQCPTEWGVQ